MKRTRKGSTPHEAMRLVLVSAPARTASLVFIAKEIANRDLYRKKDGSHPEPFQIRLRALQYHNLFELVDPEMIRLV